MGIRSVTVYVLGDGSGLTRTLNRATVDVDRFVASTSAKGGKLGDVLGSGLTKGVAAGAAGVAVGLGLAAAAAVPFEAAMHNVATISTDVQNNFEGTSKAVLGLSQQVPQSATTLAQGLYEIVSSNFAGADAFHVLEVSAKAASAGLTDTDTSARAITAALNAYGLSAASAGDVSDILFQTVNKGVVSFGDLAQNLGDFIGIAASAKVPLQDVASAYAAITLAGVPAAEAATSINQLLTKLIKPTESLAALYKQLGYESGATALKQRGLQQVITDIGKATGGSTETLVRMFNDVRAARGVLALLSADGKNYQAALDGITDASQRTGATQRAFAEQMKSAQAQLRLFANAAEAFGISVGLKVLPPLNAFLGAARSAGASALPYIEAALTRVAPLFEQVWNVAGNLARILVELGRDAAPFAQALASVAGAAVVGPLLAFLQTLSAVTGFLADHAQIVEAVAAVYLARMLPALVAAGVQMTVAAVRTAYLTVTTAAYVIATDGAAAATARLSSAVGVMSLAMTAGLAAGIFGVVRGISQWNDAQDQAKDKADKIRGAFNAYDTTKAQQQLEELRATAQHGIDVGQQYNGVWGTFKAGLSEVVGDGTVGKLAADGEAAANAYNELSAKLGNTTENIGSVAAATGKSAAAVRLLAQQQNIDLTSPFEKGADARRRLINYILDLRNQDNITSQSIAANAGMDVAAADELAKALKKVVDAATSAFAKDTDVLGNFDPSKDAKAIADAQAALEKARGKGTTSAVRNLTDEQRIARDRRSISEAEQRDAVSRTRTLSSEVSRQQSINRARQRLKDDEALIAARGKAGSAAGGQAVADAEQRLAEARAAASANSLQAQYRKALDLSRSFVRDINSAIQRGLDPTVVQRLLTEGPAKAEPALQAILRDHTGNMLKLVNTSEAQISQFSGFVAEQARITAIAINAPTDQYTKEIKTAMAIAAQEAATGGAATSAALAHSLRTSVKNIRQVAHDFGITLADDVQAAVRARGPITVHAKGVLEFAPTFGKDPSRLAQDALDAVLGRKKSTRPSVSISAHTQPRFEGGPVDWGPPGRDAVPVLATRREFIQPTAAVDHYGVPFMEKIRTRTLPRFWDGGLVGADGGLVSNVLNVAGPRIVPVPIPVASRSSTDNSTVYNIERVVTNTVSDLPPARTRVYSAMRGVS